MKYPILLFFLFSTVTYGQYQKLELTPEGVEPLVIQIDTISADLAYNSSKEWVERTYKDPDEVLKADIKNDMIRLSGYNEFGGGGYGFDYDMEVAFKDGRYRVQFTIGQLYVGGGQRCLFTYKSFYKKSDGSIKNAYKEAVEELEKDMDYLNNTLYAYITGKSQKKDDDW